MGGLLKPLDLVDYPLYMVAMNALPPVPDARRRRLAGRVAATGRSDRAVGAALVGGAARRRVLATGLGATGLRPDRVPDHARRRLGRRLPQQHVPHGRGAGGGRRAAPPAARPVEPRRDQHRAARAADRPGPGDGALVGPLAARHRQRHRREPPITVFARRSSPPEPDLDEVAGEWRNEPGWPLDRVVDDVRPLGDGHAEPRVWSPTPAPRRGSPAPATCRGGNRSTSGYDDAQSLTWEWPADDLELLGHPADGAGQRRRAGRDAGGAPLRRLPRRPLDAGHPRGAQPHAPPRPRTPEPMPVGEPVDVSVELEATSWTFDPGHRMRLAIAGTDWPNTVAPPAPVTLSLDLERLGVAPARVDGPSPCPPPSLVASTDAPTESRRRDLAGGSRRAASETSCVVDHGSTYDEEGVTCTEHYAGRSRVDTRSFAQRIDATAAFRLAVADGDRPQRGRAARRGDRHRVRGRSAAALLRRRRRVRGPTLAAGHPSRPRVAGTTWRTAAGRGPTRGDPARRGRADHRTGLRAHPGCRCRRRARRQYRVGLLPLRDQGPAAVRGVQLCRRTRPAPARPDPSLRAPALGCGCAGSWRCTGRAAGLARPGRCGSTPGRPRCACPELQAVSRRLDVHWKDIVAAVIAKASQPGEFTCDDPTAAAWRITALLDGLAVQATVHTGVLAKVDDDALGRGRWPPPSSASPERSCADARRRPAQTSQLTGKLGSVQRRPVEP